MSKERNHAVLIGINAYKKQNGLRGCINDVEDVADYLTKENAVDAKNVVKLIDDSATKAAILKSLKEMVAKLKDGDRGYFHFSGHGVRMASADQDEPDGQDEVLCPHEFDWTADTSITDNELVAVLSKVAGGAHITVVIDSCHSGHMSRNVSSVSSNPRTLTPPDDIRRQLASVTRSLNGGFRMLRAIPQIGFASACSPWQQAADAPFDNGRYNGAFSYYFLKQANTNAQKTIASLLTETIGSLAKYNMTPVSEGAVDVSLVTAIQTRSIATRFLASQQSSNQNTILRAAKEAFQQKFSATVFGQRFYVNVLIAGSNGTLDAYLTLSGFGASSPVLPFRIEGDKTVEIPLDIVGLKLIFRVTGYGVDSQMIRFNIALDIVSILPFVPAVRVGRVAVEIPTSVFTRDLSLSATPDSAAELVAMLTLQNLGKEYSSNNQASLQIPQPLSNRSIVGKVLVLGTLRCIKAEAMFGDRLDFFYGEFPIHSEVVNSGGIVTLAKTLIIPQGGSELKIVQSYFGQPQQDVLKMRVNPEDPADGGKSILIKAGDDGDPGGEYELLYAINDRYIN